MDIDDFLAEKVKSELKERRWSQAELVKRMEANGVRIHQSAISKLFAPPVGESRRKLSPAELVAIAASFNMPVGELLGETPRDLARKRRDRIRELVEELSELV